MAAPLSPTKLFVCDGCGAVLPIDASHVGKKCRCGKCGKVVTVPGHKTRKAPASPKPRPKQKPGAMHGQQYGLWEVDDAPLPEELAAREPKYFPVWCRVCDTLMHAEPRQVGRKLTCPDCGAKTVIVAPLPEKPKKSVLVPEGQEYQLDATQAPPKRRMPAVMKKLDEETERHKADPTSRPAKPSRSRGPKLPKVPLLQGVASMLWRMPVPAYIFGISIAAAIELSLLALVVGDSSGGLLAVILLLPFSALGLMIVCASSAFWLAVLTESSEGNDRLHNPPGPVFLDWMGQMLYLITAGMIGLIPGSLVCALLQDYSMEVRGPIFLLGGLVFFPILLLSELERGSPIEPISPKLWGSVLRRPGIWLLFYLETAAILAACGFAIVALARVSPSAVLIAAPLCVTASFLYFRLLGRLAWWLAESLATRDRQNEE